MATHLDSILGTRTDEPTIRELEAKIKALQYQDKQQREIIGDYMIKVAQAEKRCTKIQSDIDDLTNRFDNFITAVLGL